MEFIHKEILDILKPLDRGGSVRFEKSANEGEGLMWFLIILSYYFDILGMRAMLSKNNSLTLSRSL